MLDSYKDVQLSKYFHIYLALWYLQTREKGGKAPLMQHSPDGKIKRWWLAQDTQPGLQGGHHINQSLPTWQILGLILIAKEDCCQEMLEIFKLKSISLSATLLSLPNVKWCVHSHSAGGSSARTSPQYGTLTTPPSCLSKWELRIRTIPCDSLIWAILAQYTNQAPANSLNVW